MPFRPGRSRRGDPEKNLRAELQREREQLRQIKSDFLSAASHYINTPLSAMVGFAELLRDRSRDSSAGVRNQLIELLAIQAEETARVVRNLLTSAQLDMGELTFESELVDLQEAAGAAASNWEANQRARLVVTGNAVAVADQARVVQILHNLLMNAESLGGSNITVRVSRSVRRVLVEVAHDGEPLPKDAETRIFEPYYTHRRQDESAPSLGLGLSVARRLARAMGGEVGHRREGRETIFELTLPGALGQEVEDRGGLVVDPMAGRPTKAAIVELLGSDGIEMVYQPVAHLPAHRKGIEQISGYESLARFPHSTPPEWFEVAGDAGLRLQLELAAIRSAVAGFTATSDQGFLAVNLSDGTLTSPKLYEALSGVDPGRVVLELSDVALIKSYEMTNRAVEALRERGYRLAIDDVGAGEIDLWHILRLDPSIIKVDLSVVRDLHQSPRNAALIKAIAAMSQDLGIMVIAEGVESDNERDRLIELGVEYGQGYLLGKPQPLRWQTRVLSED